MVLGTFLDACMCNCNHLTTPHRLSCSSSPQQLLHVQVQRLLDSFHAAMFRNALKSFQSVYRSSGTRFPSIVINKQHFQTSAVLCHGGKVPTEENCDLHVVFITPEKEEITVPAIAGQSILDTAHHHGIDLEGACEGSCACSTCHVILEEDVYDQLPEPSEEEEDMLDLAFGLTNTSRLGCQIVLTKEMDGIRAKLPEMTRNFLIDKQKTG